MHANQIYLLKESKLLLYIFNDAYDYGAEQVNKNILRMIYEGHMLRMDKLDMVAEEILERDPTT